MNNFEKLRRSMGTNSLCILSLALAILLIALFGCGTPEIELRDGAQAEDVEWPPQGRPGYRRHGR